MTNGIYVEGFKDLPNGDKELITATIETDLALKMLVDYLGFEYVLKDGKPVIRHKELGQIAKPMIQKKK